MDFDYTGGLRLVKNTKCIMAANHDTMIQEQVITL